MFKKITKMQAQKRFDGGDDVFLIASKMSINSYVPFYARINNENELSFDGALNAFRYYNCNNFCGNGIHYYVQE